MVEKNEASFSSQWPSFREVDHAGHTCSAKMTQALQCRSLLLLWAPGLSDCSKSQGILGIWWPFWLNVSNPVGTGFSASQTWIQGLVPPDTSWVTLNKSLTSLVSDFLSAKWGQQPPLCWTVARTKGDNAQKEHSRVPGTQCALKYTCIDDPISILSLFLDQSFSKWQSSQ